MDVQALLARAEAGVTAARSFGPVVEAEGCTIVPAAIVLAGGGGGGEDLGPDRPGGGGGMGHGGVTWPLGAYVVRGDDVRWVPAIDATRLVLAGLALLRLGLKIRGARR